MLPKLQIGSSQLMATPVGFGTMHFGVSLQEKEAHNLLDQFIDLGGNLIDTANIYSKGNASGPFHERGQSEQIIGRWLTNSKKRNQVILASKVLLDMGDGYSGLSKKSILHQIDQSLLRLKTDHLDLYQIHGFDTNTPIEETMFALDEVVKSGKTQFIGCSNLHLNQIEQFQSIASKNKTSLFVSYQNSFNLIIKHRLNNKMGSFLLSKKEAEELGITLLAYRTLVNGFLAGKFSKEIHYDMNSESLKAVERHCFNEKGWSLLELLKSIGHSYNATPMQITLSFYRQEEAPIISLIGFSKALQIEEALNSTKINLIPKEWQALNEASKAFLI